MVPTQPILGDTRSPCERSVSVHPDVITPADLLGELWGPTFPRADMVGSAAAMFPARTDPDPLPDGLRRRWASGETWRISIGPGVVQLGTRDYERRENSTFRAEIRRDDDVDRAVAYYAEHGDWPEQPAAGRGVIEEWSRKSRARMVLRLCELDYWPLFLAGRVPAMVTLTYPGVWLVVAADGQAVKDHFAALVKRWARAWGEPLRCIWKLEFQRRGAPHIHLLTAPPHGVDTLRGLRFREWLSTTWAEIVAHPDPEQRANHVVAGTGVDYAEGLRARDPKRVAVYFLKHNVAGDKEYQHVVPEAWREPGKGPGRFWGVRGLDRAVSVVELDEGFALPVGRALRGAHRSRGLRATPARPRHRGGRVLAVNGVSTAGAATGDVVVYGLAGALYAAAHSGAPRQYRRSATRSTLFRHGRGWLSANDGPTLAVGIARYVDQLGGSQG